MTSEPIDPSGTNHHGASEAPMPETVPSRTELIVQARVKEAQDGFARGWAFTPMNGKIPLHKGWSKADKPTLDHVVRWAARWNLGFRTGAVSGVVIVDDDSQDGSATLGLKLPPTVTVRTGSGKTHFYFKHPGERIRNSVKGIAPLVDVRGDGGVAAYVGSIHPDTGKAYEWVEGRSPREIELAELPAHVLELIRARSQSGGRSRPRKSRRGQSGASALVDATQIVSSAPEGQRNDTLNRQAFRLGTLVKAGRLTREECEESLRRAAAQAGLNDAEIEPTIQSGITSGIAEGKDDKALELEKQERKQATLAAAAEDGRPVIFIEPGQLHVTVAQAERVLREARDPLSFEFGKLLVRLSNPRTQSSEKASPRRRREFVPWELPNLIEKLTGLAHWKKWDGRLQDFVSVDCPERVAKMLLARRADRQISVLRKIVSTPVLRKDYTIVQTPGYDEASELFLDIAEGEFPDVPLAPSRQQAIDALAKLKALIKGFPFVAPSDESAALAAILTALVRSALRTAPLFAFKAPKMGSGKSLLADVVALVATGDCAPTVSGEANEEELRKRFSAVLLEGAPIICIDNIERSFYSPSLCTILTQSIWKDRVLGCTATFEAPTETLWLATGNNLIFKRDLATRVIPCAMDAKVEHPEERSFDVNLREYIPANRTALVVAGLTVIRAYVAAGMPPQDILEFGRFEEWSRLVRSAIIWCGEADPCGGRRDLEDTDPDREMLIELLSAWEAEFGDAPISAAEVLKRAEGSERLSLALRAALATDDLKTAAVSLGRWLQRHAGQIEGGLYVKSAQRLQGTKLWRVSRA